MASSNQQQTFASALAAVSNDLPRQLSLKSEQEIALEAFLRRQDVLALLPTGFGKSLIYQLAPLVARAMNISTNPIVVVVSPLIALMEDQVREARSLGISSAQLSIDDEVAIKRGDYSIVFGSPEAWLSRKWRDMLAGDLFKDNLFGIVVDEVHLTYKWGQAEKGKTVFRESFSRLGELRSIVRPGIPVMALTASADLLSRAVVRKQLHMENALTVTASPNRTNIGLGLVQVGTDSLECLDWIVTSVRDKGLDMPPILIYCRTTKTVGRVFCYLKAELGEDTWVGREKKGENLLLGMFHSQTLPEIKNRVLSALSGGGSCRVVVATTALGVGLNFPNVSHVVMYGVPEDTEAMLQQVGRAGRDGSLSHAIVYSTKHNHNTDDGVKEVIRSSKSSCFRIALYCKFEDKVSSVQPAHSCCTYCHSLCSCGHTGCILSKPNYECSELHGQPLQSRHVTADEQDLVRELLLEYRNGLVQENTHLYTNATACTGFSIALVNSVVEHLRQIFDHTYIMPHLPVFNREHGIEILRIVYEVFGDFNFCEPTIVSVDSSVPDLDFLGYFDEDDDVHEHDSTIPTSSSAESGLSVLV